VSISIKEVDKMKKWGLFLFVLTVFLITTHGSASAFDSPLRFGWVIGIDENNNAVILHTKNGGRKWVVQGKWAGYADNDISAVDKHTAWAASGSDTGGKILHTTNGGVTWIEQTLPEGVDAIKNIKGLTRHEAWAVSLNGTILHTTDGGENWIEVDLGIVGIEEIQVNRMDAIGYRDVRNEDRSGKNTGPIHAKVWIADEKGGDWGMIHSLYNGDIWRRENIQSEETSGVHMVSAYSPRVVWAVQTLDGNLYRTLDGGENWENVGYVGGPNDFDDMCAYSADALWLVQYQSYVGNIYHVRLEDGKADTKTFTPDLNYNYEGLTCVNDQAAVVVGYTELPDVSQKGIILLTNDGGETWERQPLPVDDVKFWKVSFVGARR
jgi:photosystem II stability/assembly factor-like uncharacterized protein